MSPDGIFSPLPAAQDRLLIGNAANSACYNACMLPELKLDDVVRMRKPHPCGSYEWKIVRLGADIGLECLTCGRRVLLPRRKLAQRMKILVGHPKNEPK